MTIPDNWLPTSESINALPKPVREYIMRLSTDEKRAGLIAKVQILEGQLAAMNRMLEEAPEVEVTREDWLENAEQFSAQLIGKRVRLVVVDE